MTLHIWVKKNVEVCVTTTNADPEQCDSVSDAFKALFSHELIQELTHGYQSAREGNELKAKVIELSKSSGVLSMFTSFVGFSERQTPRRQPT